jgi:hypothetical protein
VVVVVRSVVVVKVRMNEEKRVVVDWGLFIMENEKKERERGTHGEGVWYERHVIIAF